MASDFDIRDSIARHYWAEAALAELSERYRERGFAVDTRTTLDGKEADLVARHGDTMEVIEVKSGSWGPDQKEAVAQLRNYVARQPNSSFKLLWVNPPRPNKVSIEGFESILAGIWDERVADSPIAELATNVIFDSVDDFRFAEIRVKPHQIEVAGEGTVSFELEYGGGGEDGFITSDSYPFSFRIILSPELEVEEILEWAVDVSSFYE